MEAVKNKWRGLRDTFRKELNKLPKKRSGQAAEPAQDSKWQCFQSMMFLKDQFESRKLQSSIPTPEVDTQSGKDGRESEDIPEDETNQNFDQDVVLDAEREKTNESSEFVPPQTKRVKTQKSNAIQQLLAIEQEKLKQFKQKTEELNQERHTEDADYHFLISLLPALRKVPEERKMCVRMKLQQVFCDEDDFARRSYSCHNISKLNSQHSALAELPQHLMENYTASPDLTVLTTPSGPSSGESSSQQYEDVASFFVNNNSHV